VQKGGGCYEARKGSPISNKVKFKAKDAETRTQLVKIMYMIVVTSTTPIACIELDFQKWNKENRAKTKSGKLAKGITSGYLVTVLEQIAELARKKLGKGKITYLHDKAPCYMGVVKSGDKCGFDALEVAAGKAPDMSHLDAGFCQFLERAVQADTAQSADEIRKAVAKAWKLVTPKMCQDVSKRVWNNMGEVIRLEGGNFYSE
jgi:hypothetical protein